MLIAGSQPILQTDVSLMGAGVVTTHVPIEV
jgi:hypothetical protein